MEDWYCMRLWIANKALFTFSAEPCFDNKTNFARDHCEDKDLELTCRIVAEGGNELCTLVVLLQYMEYSSFLTVAQSSLICFSQTIRVLFSQHTHPTI